MDVLKTLSLARTALDDPGGLPDYEGELREGALRLYAIHRIDEAIHALDVELHPALALTTVGKLIAEIADDLDDHGVGGDGEPFDTRDIAEELSLALDALDRAIAALDQA